MSTEKTPTLDEFTEAVKKSFWKGWTTLSEKEVDEYINGEEAQTEITGRYAEAKRDFEKGEITRNVFMVGCVSAVAYCLEMMY